MKIDPEVLREMLAAAAEDSLWIPGAGVLPDKSGPAIYLSPDHYPYDYRSVPESVLERNRREDAYRIAREKIRR